MFLLSITLKWMKWMEIVNTDLNYLILLMLLSIFCMNNLKNEQVILIVGNSQKLLSTLCNQKKIFFFLCIYKMYLISAEGYKNANVGFLTIKTTSERCWKWYRC